MRQKSLDSLIGENKPIMIKMDVEGYEEDVLLGSQTVLANPCLQLIVLETVTPFIETMLTDHNFKSVYYNPVSRRLSHKGENYTSLNSTFARDLEFTTTRLASGGPVTVFGRII